jgi:Kef-type K+ transport system membrane component KefB
MSAATATLTTLELTRFFLAIASLLFLAHSFGFLFYRARLPRVVGEIFGGLVLGPTILGYFSPSTQAWVFNAFPEEGKLISIVSYFGLILLMFISGFEIQRSFSSSDRQIAVAFLLGATFVPFIIGMLTPYFYDFTPYSGPNGNLLSLSIIVGIGVSVTSIPVISKIFIDLKMIDTSFAKIVLTIATVEDIIQFGALAIATGVGGPSALSLPVIASTVIVTVGFFAAGLYGLPRLVMYTLRSRFDILIRSHPSRYGLFVCFSLVALASLLNVNIAFGAFLAGVAIGTMPEEVFRNAKSQIKSISTALFTPVYFAAVGLRLDLVHGFDAAFFLGFFLFSTSLKVIGALGVGRIVRQRWLSSFNLAITLNARGGPGIVLATIVFDLGLISETFFVALVLTAIVTSLMAGYWLRYVRSRKWELLQRRSL